MFLGQYHWVVPMWCLNRHRSITATLFWLNLVWKTSYYTFCIILTAQDILVCWTEIKGLSVCVATVTNSKNADMWSVKCKFLYCRYVEKFMEVHNLWLHHEKLFSCIIFGIYNWICRSFTQLKCFRFVKMVPSVHSIMWNVLIHMKTYDWDNILIVLIWFWNWKINTWTLCTTMQHPFPIC